MMKNWFCTTLAWIIFILIFRGTLDAYHWRNSSLQQHLRLKRSGQQFCALRQEPKCCPGTNCCGPPDGGGCCCDEACYLQYNDCCPDYFETCHNDECNSNEEIKFEEKRSADYVTDFEIDVPFSDEDLNETLWYKVVSDNGDAMPTYPPGVNHCGTVYPIWLNGNWSSVFENETTTNETKLLTACQQTENDICATTLEINIKQCSDGSYAYKLKPSPTNSSYCFGSGPVKCESGLSSESGFYPGCSGSFPNQTIHPEVKALLVDGDIYTIGGYDPSPSLLSVFACDFEALSDISYVYDIYWFINGELLKNQTNVLFDSSNTTYLIPDDWVKKYKMNMEVTCSVRVRNFPGSIPSPFYSSPIFKAGVFPEKYEYTVIENEHVTIPFRSTVPVSCLSSNKDVMHRCEQNFYIFQPKYQENTDSCVNNINARDIVFKTEFCGFKFGTLDWNKTKNLEVYGYSDGKYNSYFRVTYIRLATDAVAGFDGAMWENVSVPDIKVTVLDKDFVMTGRMCQSSNDPHIRTFDGMYYHYMEIGEYVLYRNDKGPYWVHALFTNCGFGWTGSSCHCGIAVRSKRSLFVLRTCSRVSRTDKLLLTQPYTEIRTCDDNDLLVVTNGNRYTIKLPIGTEIQFTVSVYQMFISSITIKPTLHDIGVARGLCGVPSPTQNTSDDFTDRDTDTVTPEKAFADSWKIDRHSMPDEQLFINEPTFLTEDVAVSVNVTESNFTLPHFCICEREAGRLDNFALFYSLQCNMTEPTQVCSTAPLSTQAAFVTSCTTSKGDRVKRSFHGRIVRRSVDNSDDVIDSDPLEFEDDNLDQNSTLHEPEFRNGWSKEEANKTCEEQIKSLVPTDLVSDVSGAGNDDYVQFCIQSCILDIKLIADTTYIQDTVGAMQTLTLMEASRNENLTQLQSEDGSMTMMEYITSLMCNCSGNGNCTAGGVCACYEGFVGDDCSIPISQPPPVGSLPEDGFCKTNKRACLSTNVFGIFLSSDVWCKRIHFKVVNNSKDFTDGAEYQKVLYRNPTMITVSLSKSRRKRSTTEISGPEGYELSFSYDGINYGNKSTIIIYDEDCYSCTQDPVICVIVTTCPELSTPKETTKFGSSHSTNPALYSDSTYTSDTTQSASTTDISVERSVDTLSTSALQDTKFTSKVSETRYTRTNFVTEVGSTSTGKESTTTTFSTESTSTFLPETESTSTSPKSESTSTSPETDPTSTSLPETESTSTTPATDSTSTFPKTESTLSTSALQDTKFTSKVSETKYTRTNFVTEDGSTSTGKESTTTTFSTESTSTFLPETDPTSTSLPETDPTSTSLPETDPTSTSLPETESTSTTPATDSTSTSLPETELTSTSPETDSTSTFPKTESTLSTSALQDTKFTSKVSETKYTRTNFVTEDGSTSTGKESTTTTFSTESTSTFLPETESTSTSPKSESTSTSPETDPTSTSLPETESTSTTPATDSTSTSLPETELTSTSPETDSTSTFPKTESTLSTSALQDTKFTSKVSETKYTRTNFVTEDGSTSTGKESTTTTFSTESTSTFLPETDPTSTSLPETESTSTSLPETESTSTTPATDSTSTSLPETELTSTSPETDSTSTFPKTESTLSTSALQDTKFTSKVSETKYTRTNFVTEDGSTSTGKESTTTTFSTESTSTFLPETESTSTSPKSESTSTSPETDPTSTSLPETESTSTTPATDSTSTSLPETELTSTSPETDSTSTFPKTESTLSTSALQDTKFTSKVSETKYTRTNFVTEDGSTSTGKESTITTFSTESTSTFLPETDPTSTSFPETDPTSTSLSETESTSTSLPETESTSTSPERDSKSTLAKTESTLTTSETEFTSTFQEIETILLTSKTDLTLTTANKDNFSASSKTEATSTTIETETISTTHKTKSSSAETESDSLITEIKSTLTTAELTSTNKKAISSTLSAKTYTSGLSNTQSPTTNPVSATMTSSAKADSQTTTFTQETSNASLKHKPSTRPVTTNKAITPSETVSISVTLEEGSSISPVESKSSTIPANKITNSTNKVALSEGLKAIIATISVVVFVVVVIFVTFLSWSLCRRRSGKKLANGSLRTNDEQWKIYRENREDVKPNILQPALRINLSKRQNSYDNFTG